MKTPSSASLIHPLAKVHAGAKVANSAVVSAFAVIEEGVSIGSNCFIANHAVIKKGSVIGSHNTILENVVIGGNPQDLSFKQDVISGVQIGNHNTLREGVTVNRASVANTNTIIGSNNFLMAHVHIAHDCTLHNHNVIANNTLLAGFVCVYSHCFISGNCAVHQHTRIGHFAMLSGLCGVSQDVPIGALVEGNKARFCSLNLVGLRKAGITQNAKKVLRKFYINFYQLPRIEFFKKYSHFEELKNTHKKDESKQDANEKKDANKSYAKFLNPGINFLNCEEEIITTALAFIKSSKRGIVPHALGSKGSNLVPLTNK